MLRYLLVLCFVSFTAARFRGSSAFIVEETEDYNMAATAAPEPITTEQQTTETTQAEAMSTTLSSAMTTIRLAGDGHDPMEVVEAAVDLVNTPFYRVVGSNPLRRLLRLIGPTKDDFLQPIKLVQEVQKASGQPTVETPVTDLPPVLNQLFGFQESDDELFRRTTTLAPLFPVVKYDHEAAWKALEKMLANAAAKTTLAPLPKL